MDGGNQSLSMVRGPPSKSETFFHFSCLTGKGLCVENEPLLIRHAQKGDHDAFAALVQEHQRYIYNLALRILKDENEALDLAQETFVRAWTALPNFKGQSQFRTWLYRIATNLCYNRLPNLRRSLNDLGDDVMEDIAEPDFDAPIQEIESNETRRYLQQAMEELDENYRLLITLRYQNELSYEEIASTLNLPLGTVKTGIFRAKAQLRNALAVLEESWTPA
jgi:RNA polymerase sigma-70 factor (ECF subfamily)